MKSFPSPSYFAKRSCICPMRRREVVLFCASDTVALDQLSQVVACKSCGLSTPSDVAMVSIEKRLEVGGFEGVQNLLFRLLERERLSDELFRRFLWERGRRNVLQSWQEIFHIELEIFSEGGGSFNRVFELADIARPAVGLETGHRHGSNRKLLRFPPTASSHEVLQKIIDQQTHVLFSVAQGG